MEESHRIALATSEHGRADAEATAVAPKAGALDISSCIWTYQHDHEVSTVAFHPSAQYVMVGCKNRNVRLWDSKTGQVARDLAVNSCDTTCISFHPNSSKYVTGAADGTVVVWDGSKHMPLFTLSDHTDGIRSVAFEPVGGRLFATASLDKSIRLYDTATYRAVATLTEHDDAVLCVAFHPR